jgi:hypothetical protein
VKRVPDGSSCELKHIARVHTTLKCCIERNIFVCIKKRKKTQRNAPELKKNTVALVE